MSNIATYPVQIAQPPNPATGSDWTYTFPDFGSAYASGNSQLICVTASLATSAVVANRTPRILLQVGAGRVIFSAPLLPAQTASLTFSYSWYPGAPASAATGIVMTAPIPPGLIPGAGLTLSTVTANIAAGDAWTNIVIALG